jgi:hypothetical protein
MGAEFISSLLAMGLYPVCIIPAAKPRGKLSPSLLAELVERRTVGSLRQIAKEYGVSYETVRRIEKGGEAGGGGIMGRMRNCLQSRSGRDLDVGCFQERTAAAKTLI